MTWKQIHTEHKPQGVLLRNFLHCWRYKQILLPKLFSQIAGEFSAVFGVQNVFVFWDKTFLESALSEPDPHENVLQLASLLVSELDKGGGQIVRIVDATLFGRVWAGVILVLLKNKVKDLMLVLQTLLHFKKQMLKYCFFLCPYLIIRTSRKAVRTAAGTRLIPLFGLRLQTRRFGGFQSEPSQQPKAWRIPLECVMTFFVIIVDRFCTEGRRSLSRGRSFLVEVVVLWAVLFHLFDQVVPLFARGVFVAQIEGFLRAHLALFRERELAPDFVERELMLESGYSGEAAFGDFVSN